MAEEAEKKAQVDDEGAVYIGKASFRVMPVARDSRSTESQITSVSVLGSPSPAPTRTDLAEDQETPPPALKASPVEAAVSPPALTEDGLEIEDENEDENESHGLQIEDDGFEIEVSLSSSAEPLAPAVAQMTAPEQAEAAQAEPALETLQQPADPPGSESAARASDAIWMDDSIRGLRELFTASGSETNPPATSEQSEIVQADVVQELPAAPAAEYGVVSGNETVPLIAPTSVDEAPTTIPDVEAHTAPSSQAPQTVFVSDEPLPAATSVETEPPMKPDAPGEISLADPESSAVAPDDQGNATTSSASLPVAGFAGEEESPPAVYAREADVSATYQAESQVVSLPHEASPATPSSESSTLSGPVVVVPEATAMAEALIWPTKIETEQDIGLSTTMPPAPLPATPAAIVPLPVTARSAPRYRTAMIATGSFLAGVGVTLALGAMLGGSNGAAEAPGPSQAAQVAPSVPAGRPVAQPSSTASNRALAGSPSAAAGVAAPAPQSTATARATVGGAAGEPGPAVHAVTDRGHRTRVGRPKAGRTSGLTQARGSAPRAGIRGKGRNEPPPIDPFDEPAARSKSRASTFVDPFNN